MPLDAGTRVGRFTIRRLVAQGGMAEVYLADQELTPGITRPAAVKVIRPEYSESDEFREMFLDEARTACTLSHPNIAHIYEVGETDEGLLFMAMEFVPGETLATINRTLRSNDERFSDEAIFAIGINTCAALEAVHALMVEGGTVGLVHRDVSPHNLLLSPTGALKLIDFGIAKAATNRNLTMPGVTKGKAGYFSPEQAMGKKLDGRSDLFSLGITLYKLASGQTPFDTHKNHAERHAALVRGQWDKLETVYPGMTPGFYRAIDTTLQLKPEARFQSAREMREALEQAAFDGGIRVSQSGLIGYVDHDGEVTATGGSRSSSSIPIANPPTATQQAPRFEGTLPGEPAPRTERRPSSSARQQVLPAEHTPTHRTERLPPGPARPRALPVPYLIAAFVAAVGLGIFGVLLLLREPAPEVPFPRPVVDVQPLEKRPVPDVIAPQVDVVVIEVERDAGTPTPVAVVTPRPRKDPVRRPPTKADPPPDKTPPVVKVVQPAEEIPAGVGTLRIGSIPRDAVATFLVGSKTLPSPVNEKVSSGLYTVRARLADGTTSAPWKGAVRPEQTTVLQYDATAGRWSAR